MPVSPYNSTVESVAATRLTSRRTRFHCHALRDDRVVAHLRREFLAQVLVVELEAFFELRDLGVGVLQREVGPLAVEGVREDVRNHRETILQQHRATRARAAPCRMVSAPLTEPPTTSGNNRCDFGMCFPMDARSTAASGGSSANVRIREDSALEDLAKGIRQGLMRDESRRRLTSLDDPLVRVLESPAVGRPLKQVAAIDTEELDERSQRAR